MSSIAKVSPRGRSLARFRKSPGEVGRQAPEAYKAIGPLTVLDDVSFGARARGNLKAVGSSPTVPTLCSRLRKTNPLAYNIKKRAA